MKYKSNVDYGNWCKEGNWVVTRNIQKESGLPLRAQSKIACIEGSRNENGENFRHNERMEILSLLSAAPDILYAAQRAQAFMIGTKDEELPKKKTRLEEFESIVRNLNYAINKALTNGK
tara:strand:- start:327 stop:683 length:357 start_codon:yes stop_codon:yes gene_type:complete